jgi:hypothetical protein
MTVVPDVCGDQTRGRCDQVSVVQRVSAIGQDSDVFQAGPNPMPSIQSASIHRPTRYAVAVVNLFQADSRGDHNVFHLGSVLNGNVGVGVERLDQDASASTGESGPHKSARILTAQQSSLDTDASRQQ